MTGPLQDTLARRVAAFAERERLFRRVQSVLVAVSGGPDSVACLLLLLALRERFGFTVQVAHFDHQLRPGSADDLAAVRALSERLEVACFTGEGDVGGVARQQRRGIEETARMMRYQFLAFVAAEKRADCVATGHTAADQAETVLARVVRGTGVRGLRGMLPASGIPGSPAQRLVRPLLEITREETAALCAEAGVEPSVDPTNFELSATRNILRHRVLPVLAELNPSIRDALTGLAANAREAFADIERQSHAAQPTARTPAGSIFERASLASLPSEALTLVIEREAAFGKLELDVNRTRQRDLRRVLSSGTGEVRFGQVAVQASSGQVRVGPPLEPEPFEPKVLNVPGTTLAGDWRVDVSTEELPATGTSRLVALDAAAIRGVLRVRRPAPGDRVAYHGIVRKLADIFANAHVPAWERMGAVALADRDGVHAALTASTTFAADIPPGADLLHVRLSPAVR